MTVAGSSRREHLRRRCGARELRQLKLRDRRCGMPERRRFRTKLVIASFSSSTFFSTSSSLAAFPSPYFLFLPCSSIALSLSRFLSLLPPTRALFSNDGHRGAVRQRGNLLTLRRIRADCLPLRVSKRAQTSLTPTLPEPGIRPPPLLLAQVRSRFNST